MEKKNVLVVVFIIVGTVRVRVELLVALEV